MLRLSLSLAGSLSFAGSLACAFASTGVGCAVSAPADLTPGMNSNLPGLDAGSDPVPVPGAADGEDGEPGPDDAGAPSDAAKSPDASVNPVAPLDSGIDAAPTMPKPSPGELLITEIMYDTFGIEPASEWIELHSKAKVARMLSGLTVKDGSGRTHLLGAGLTIAPGAYVLLVRDRAGALATKVPPAAIVYEYGTGLPANAGVLLTNSATGGVSVLNGPVVLATAPYGGWFSQSGGSSVQLDVLDSSASSSASSWCLSLNPWTTGSEKGTPGAASDCP